MLKLDVDSLREFSSYPGLDVRARSVYAATQAQDFRYYNILI